ncbi:MAG: hypothetical protein QXP42_01135 [Candidatus Micrarchaeia archaeon]
MKFSLTETALIAFFAFFIIFLVVVLTSTPPKSVAAYKLYSIKPDLEYTYIVLSKSNSSQITKISRHVLGASDGYWIIDTSLEGGEKIRTWVSKSTLVCAKAILIFGSREKEAVCPEPFYNEELLHGGREKINFSMGSFVADVYSSKDGKLRFWQVPEIPVPVKIDLGENILLLENCTHPPHI